MLSQKLAFVNSLSALKTERKKEGFDQEMTENETDVKKIQL